MEVEMEWIKTIDELPSDGQRVIAFVPENYVPLAGSPGQVELKPIKVLTIPFFAN